MQLNYCIDVALTTLKNEVCSSLEQVQHRQNHCIYFHIALPIHLSCCSKRVLLGVKQQFNLHVHSISALRKETAKKSCQLVLIVGAVFLLPCPLKIGLQPSTSFPMLPIRFIQVTSTSPVSLF